ncbi:lipocalin family protein [Frigoriflavimonas asaccharolytica]|uniref:Outer membrane lipoprotein Blc n=1 Tax=Frigoriflavimonas asaccharolytica TaxID=2735899 RepID=A0A8J8KAS0_9FLAO|nr:lipocalin family protein [Frigoriflavimonas asaccharolytica]NRS91759.1 apolipoprotein D and lipocalin family protein [Frigoriflavimonas asaccharolytica]
MKNLNKISLALGLSVSFLLILNSCATGLPKGATAVSNFDSNKYLGKWYEIARFDFRFEKNLNQVTATYSKKENGNIKVENRGYDYVKNEWKESIGEAKFVKNPNIAELKVSFFKPIWASYNVIDIDEDYKYALVVGNNKDYMWILSREKTLPESYKQRFLSKAKSLGFEIENLIWVEQK